MPLQFTGPSLEYDVVDVFGETPYSGNQLAVVHGAGGLSTAQLQAVAQEFNYSETTFPVPLGDGRYAVRIFTAGAELPFAGHPTLGTAWVLRSRGELAGDAATQLCGAGEIGVVFDRDLVRLSAVRRVLEGPVDRATTVSLLADLGLAAADLVGDAWVAGVGLSFVHVPVRDDAVGRAHVSVRPLSEYATALAVGSADPVDGINLYSVTAGEPLAVHARVFVPGLSVAEDPATGSAAAGLGLALVATGQLTGGGAYVINQGSEMGRPSRLHGVVDAAGVRCQVAGRVHPIASGRIAQPPA